MIDCILSCKQIFREAESPLIDFDAALVIRSNRALHKVFA